MHNALIHKKMFKFQSISDTSMNISLWIVHQMPR
uniref:Uncharacterized protein n=1 Tax=Arundo donax TaxID=35708 RepID=A0A0A9GXP7_ARUDO